MLTSRKDTPRMIKMRCPAGKLVPREPSGFTLEKWQRFYNWPRDADGQPMPDDVGFPMPSDIKEKVVDVPHDHHHALLILKGPCSVVDEAPARKAAPVPKKDKG